MYDRDDGNKLDLLQKQVVRILVFPDSKKDGLTETIIARPLREWRSQLGATISVVRKAMFLSLGRFLGPLLLDRQPE
jgi:hypothetical protein